MKDSKFLRLSLALLLILPIFGMIISGYLFESVLFFEISLVIWCLGLVIIQLFCNKFAFKKKRMKLKFNIQPRDRLDLFKLKFVNE